MAVKLVLANYTSLSTPQLGFAAMTLLMCALALLMCASHSRRRRRQWNECYGFFDEEDLVTVIEHHHEAAIFGPHISDDAEREVEEEEEEEEEEEGEGVWQKNILMGGKCQLPDFSGVIIYDADGNMVAPHKTPRLTWK